MVGASLNKDGGVEMVEGVDEGLKDDVPVDRVTVMENGDPSVYTPVSSSFDNVGATDDSSSCTTLGPKSPSFTGGTVGLIMNDAIDGTLVEKGEELDPIVKEGAGDAEVTLSAVLGGKDGAASS